MNFAGPSDATLRDTLARAYARRIVLIAAVGNAGPRSPPLYPAADPHVIGVTAADADDKLLPQANRGPQVTFAAPDVAVIEPAPANSYQVTSGTSVAAAHASGVAALVPARDPKLSPASVRRMMIRGTHRSAGSRREVGAGEIDAPGALNALTKYRLGGWTRPPKAECLRGITASRHGQPRRHPPSYRQKFVGYHDIG